MLWTMARSAVDVLSITRLPSKLIKDNMARKDMLFNDVIDYLQERGLAWGSSKADVVGKKFVSSLVNCLWYIDGRIHVFTKQGFKLPDLVTCFVGYNKPEASKHRKRTVENVCQLYVYIQLLFSVAWNLFIGKNLILMF